MNRWRIRGKHSRLDDPSHPRPCDRCCATLRTVEVAVCLERIPREFSRCWYTSALVQHEIVDLVRHRTAAESLGRCYAWRSFHWNSRPCVHTKIWSKTYGASPASFVFDKDDLSVFRRSIIISHQFYCLKTIDGNTRRTLFES